MEDPQPRKPGTEWGTGKNRATVVNSTSNKSMNRTTATLSSHSCGYLSGLAYDAALHLFYMHCSLQVLGICSTLIKQCLLKQGTEERPTLPVVLQSNDPFSPRLLLLLLLLVL